MEERNYQFLRALKREAQLQSAGRDQWVADWVADCILNLRPTLTRIEATHLALSYLEAGYLEADHPEAARQETSDAGLKLVKPPTTNSLRLLQLLCKPATYAQLEQIWVDALEEHYAALKKEDEWLARAAIWRGRLDLITSALSLLPSRVVDWLVKMVSM